MSDEFERDYRTQHCGDEWFTAGGIGEDTLISDADEIRLWEGNDVLAVIKYAPVPGEPNTRGTYTITEHNFPQRKFTEDELTGWRDWRDALELASGIERGLWDKD